jgi:hypothetical protein
MEEKIRAWERKESELVVPPCPSKWWYLNVVAAYEQPPTLVAHVGHMKQVPVTTV